VSARGFFRLWPALGVCRQSGPVSQIFGGLQLPPIIVDLKKPSLVLPKIKIIIEIDPNTQSTKVEAPRTFKAIDTALVLNQVVTSMLSQDSQERSMLIGGKDRQAGQANPLENPSEGQA
jgi:hypothetical protein